MRFNQISRQNICAIMDSDGDMMMRVGNNMAMDMDSGELHMVTGWDDDDNDHGFYTKLK